jgi:hypothetical protein
MTALSHNLGQPLVEGVSNAYAANHAALEEGKLPNAFRMVVNPVWYNEVARSDLVLQDPTAERAMMERTLSCQGAAMLA